MLDRRLQQLLQSPYFGLEVSDDRILVSRSDVGRFGQRRLLRLIEEHSKDISTGRIVERAHSHIDVGKSGTTREPHAFCIDAFAMLQRLKERSLKLQSQFGVDQGEQIVRRFTADVSEEPADIL
ncbi:hypothetical protein AWB81_08315 [Caballeronia arationis]|nr:hypothetical protein AWB81_08315 [Caballeronia arationis]